MMNRFLLLIITIFFYTSLNAALYKGQKVFVKECMNCHKDGLAFVKSKDIKSWSALMDRKGTELAEAHLRDIRAEESWEYFNGAKYSKKTKHLKQFLVEYAKDSEKVPALN